MRVDKERLPSPAGVEDFKSENNGVYKPQALSIDLVTVQGGRWSARIVNHTINTDPKGKQYVAYTMAVTYDGAQGEHLSWDSMRRYSDFNDFHHIVRCIQMRPYVFMFMSRSVCSGRYI